MCLGKEVITDFTSTKLIAQRKIFLRVRLIEINPSGKRVISFTISAVKMKPKTLSKTLNAQNTGDYRVLMKIEWYMIISFPPDHIFLLGSCSVIFKALWFGYTIVRFLILNNFCFLKPWKNLFIYFLYLSTNQSVTLLDSYFCQLLKRKLICEDQI